MNIINVKINEKNCQIANGKKLAEIIAEFKPDANLFIVNGFPQTPDYQIYEGDLIVLIKKGEVPSSDEMAALLAARQTPGVTEQLRQSVVGIAGVGGLGSNVAMSLARCGVGELILVDYDVVEPSNLNRQAYFVEQIGQPKVLAMRDILLKCNPYVKITVHLAVLSPPLVETIFNRADVVVEAFDVPETKAMLLNSMRKFLPNKPGVFASGLAGDGVASLITTRKVYHNIYLVGDSVSEAAPNIGLMAPRVTLAAGMQANAVLRILQGKDVVE